MIFFFPVFSYSDIACILGCSKVNSPMSPAIEFLVSKTNLNNLLGYLFPYCGDSYNTYIFVVIHSFVWMLC